MTKGCDRQVDIGRRFFLRGGAMAAAGAAASVAVSAAAEAKPAPCLRSSLVSPAARN